MIQSLANPLQRWIPSPKSDSELLQSCALGGKELDRAFETLMRRHYRHVWMVARNMDIPPEDAEDIAQEVFSVLNEQINQLSTHPAIAGWLHETARRKSIVYFRKRKQVDPTPKNNEEFYETIERQDQILTAFKSLSGEEQRLMLLLKDDPSMTDAELAEKLGKSLDSTKKMRQRAFGKLRKEKLDG